MAKRRVPNKTRKRMESLLELWEQGSGDLAHVDGFLSLHCQDDPAVAAEFRELIRADAQMKAYDPLNIIASKPPAAAKGSKQPGWPETDKLQPGQEVGGYQIVNQVGEGGMGVVYRAHDSTLKRDVALKVILDRGSLTAQEQSRFLQEAEIIARVQHQHIVQIYAYGNVNGRPYYAMEYVAGGSLAKRLARKPQSPTAAARLVMLLARAVQASHDQNILHRDLKPSNVLLAPAQPKMPGLNTKWGCPKLADFGLAKRLDQEGRLTISGAAVGTPVYMAPEQARGRHTDIGFATDVYGLGAILYEMLAGRPPFAGATPFEVMERVVNEAPAAPTTEQPDIPEELEQICLKCLAKKPAERYPTARALGEALEDFLDRHEDSDDSEAEEEELVFDLPGMLEIFGKYLYNEFGAIVRELVQNGHDAVNEACARNTSHDGCLKEGRVDVQFNQLEERLVVADTGLGMNKEDIRQSLNNFGRSLKRALRKSLTEVPTKGRLLIIGQYGVGFLSAMAMSSKVEVWSKKGDCPVVHWKYQRGRKGAMIAEASDLEWNRLRQNLNLPTESVTGTVVICNVPLDIQREYEVDGEAIHNSLLKYARILKVPIFFNKQQISGRHAAWSNPLLASEADWREMIEQTTHESPLLIIPISSPPDQLDLEGVVWIPMRRQIVGASYIEVYIQRMFVTRDDRIIRPRWANFIMGMINSNHESMIRTVSGDKIIEGRQASETQEFIKAKVIEAFKALRALPEEDYWRIIGPHDDTIKYSAIDNDEFMDCVWDKLLVRIRARRLSLPDYLAIIERKTGEKDLVYYFNRPADEFAANTVSDATGIPVISMCPKDGADEAFVRRVSERRSIRLEHFRKLLEFNTARAKDEDSYKTLVAACASHNIIADIREIQPSHIPAMLIADKTLEERRRDMLTTLLRQTADGGAPLQLDKLFDPTRALNRGVSFYLNSANSLIRDLRAAPFETQQAICLALYNISFMSAMPELKKNEVELVYNSISSVLITLLKQCAPAVDITAGRENCTTRLLLLIPHAGTYAKVEAAVREVFEAPPYFFEVVAPLETPGTPKHWEELLGHIGGVDGFIVEVSERHAGVMLELGAVMAYKSARRPMFLLDCSNSDAGLPGGFSTQQLVPYGGADGEVSAIAKSIRGALERNGQPTNRELLGLLKRRTGKALTRTLISNAGLTLQPSGVTQLLHEFAAVEKLLQADPSDVANLTGLSRRKVEYLQSELHDLALRTEAIGNGDLDRDDLTSPSGK
jgi:HSP90 family molecular chaperone